MNCLFCKQKSDKSRSIEHIIPESLGNKNHVLPKCFVCDNCNQYFAIKVEKPLLEQPYFMHLRNRSRIENKKRNVPAVDVMAVGMMPMKVELSFEKKEGFGTTLPDVTDANAFFANSVRKLIIPVIDLPKDNNVILSKFLAKLAIESMIYRVLYDQILVKELWNHSGLDRLKQYARYGQGISFWPYYQRRIYPEGAVFKDDTLEGAPFEILHEFTFLGTNESNLYFIACIMGIEYTINVNAPEISTYFTWLDVNNNRSTLDNTNEIRL
jgi:hypothetical protein